MEVNREVEEHWKKNGDYVKFKVKEGSTYDMIRGDLTRYAYGRLKNWMDAEDAVQDTYLHMIQFPPKGEGHNFGGLFKLTLDRKISLIRNKQRNKSVPIVDEVDDEEESLIDKAPSEEVEPDLTFSLMEQVELVMELSNILKPKAKRIVRLACIFGYSYQEVAKHESVSVKTVENTLNYFRKKIRNNPQYEGEEDHW